MQAECLELRSGAQPRAHALGLHRAVHGSLVEYEQVAGDLRDALGDGEDFVVELPAGNTRLAKPASTASAPLIESPVSNASIARRIPMNQGCHIRSGGAIVRTGG